MEKIVKKLNLNDQGNDLEFWLTKSYEERLIALENLRQQYFKFFTNGLGTRLQRVYRVTKRS